MTGRYFEDFSAGEVVDLGTVRVTRDEIIAFARQYDPQPFHVDPDAAATHATFGGLIASGWQTAGLYMRLFVESVLGQTESLGSPGVDTLRWLLPVRPGDVLRGRYTVLSTRLSESRPDRGIVRSRAEMLNQHGELVMRFEATNFLGRRPAESGSPEGG